PCTAPHQEAVPTSDSPPRSWRTQDHVDRFTVGPGGADGPQRGQRVARTLVLADHTPQPVLTDGVAAVELPHPGGLVIVGRQPVRSARRRPPDPGNRLDGQRAELVEGEGPVRMLLDGLLDAGQLDLALGVW